MINILRMINKEKIRIDQELLEEDERFEFYQDFFKKNKTSTLNDVINLNHSDLAIAIIINMEPELSVEELKEVVYGNRDIFENLNFDSISELVRLIDGLANDPELYHDIRKAAITKADKKLTSRFKKESQMASMIRILTDSMDTTPEMFFDFVDMFIDHSEGFVIALSTVATLKDIKEEKEFHYQMIQDICEEEGAKVKRKVQDKWVSEMVRDDYKIANLLKPINDARNEYHHLDQEQRNRKRNLSKTKVVYESLETNLYKAIQSGEVRNVETLLKKVPSDEIRIAILKLVYTHNQEIYKNLSEEYKILAANDASHYRVLLAKYGISPEDYEVGTVMENSIEDLENILKLLTKLSITNPTEILSIIQNTNLETITNIQGLTERGIITSQLLVEHQSILNPNSKEYEDFMRNLSLINKKKLNPHHFTTAEDVLITNHEVLTNSLSTLEDYDLLSNIKSKMNLTFLKNTDLKESIDLLLELGYESNLEECLDLLNYKDKFDRLKVVKELNIPIGSTQELIGILTTDKFYVPDKDISKYVYNASNYNLPRGIVEVEEPKKKVSDVSRLSEFSNTSRTYSFNGVLISKNRVHRNLSHILATGKPTDRLVYAILKGATLNDEEVSKVKTSLAPQKQIIKK